MRLSAVKFIRKISSKSFNNGIVYIRVGFNRIFAGVSRQYTELFYKLFTRSTESGKSMGGCNFTKILPINVPKCHGGNIYVSWQEILKVVRILLSGNWSYPSITDIVEVMKTLAQERHNHSENCITVKMSKRTQKIEIYLANEGSGLAFFSRIWDTFSEVLLVMNLE